MHNTSRYFHQFFSLELTVVMFPYDIHTSIIRELSYELDECQLMTLRLVCKEWKENCEYMIRDRNESNVKHMLLSCRYKCDRVPLKWLVIRNKVAKNNIKSPEYRCAYCNGIVYQIGECKNKHRKPYKIAQQILIGPVITSVVCSILYTYS